MSDIIEQPNHYTWHPSGVECKTITNRGFEHRVASAIEYIWRHAYKGKPVEDLRKAIECLQEEVRTLEADDAKHALPGETPCAARWRHGVNSEWIPCVMTANHYGLHETPAGTLFQKDVSVRGNA